MALDSVADADYLLIGLSFMNPDNDADAERKTRLMGRLEDAQRRLAL